MSGSPVTMSIGGLWSREQGTHAIAVPGPLAATTLQWFFSNVCTDLATVEAADQYPFSECHPKGLPFIRTSALRSFGGFLPDSCPGRRGTEPFQGRGSRSHREAGPNQACNQPELRDLANTGCPRL